MSATRIRAWATREGERHHFSARLRITLWFTALFVVGAALLLALNYALVARSFSANPDEVRAAVAREIGAEPGSLQAVDGDESGIAPAAEGTERDIFREAQHAVAHAHLGHLMTESAIALGAMAVVAIGLGWMIAGRVLRPVHLMTAKARRLSESNLHERLALGGPDDELKELADTFDAMLGRLESAFDSQRRFVADASHELRTPLSVIRTEVEVTLADPDATVGDLRSMATRIGSATSRMERLIDSLLVLARSDTGVLASDAVDLAALTARVADRFQAAANGRNLRVDRDLTPSPLRGDRALLERLVANLVDNAIVHNVDGGWIRLSTSQRDGLATLAVENSGPPVAPDSVDELFRRFHRGEAARNSTVPGHGIGLSLVDAIATAHGGTVEAHARPDGGLTVEVVLPGR